MNTSSIIGLILFTGVVAGAIFYYFRKRNVEKFFHQVFEESKKIPKQKKNSFILLMFKESITSAKNKSKATSFANKLQNPKYLDIQLVHMSSILKDPSKVQDKTIKKALSLYKAYKTWEKAKFDKEKKEVLDKAS